MTTESKLRLDMTTETGLSVSFDMDSLGKDVFFCDDEDTLIIKVSGSGREALEQMIEKTIEDNAFIQILNKHIADAGIEYKDLVITNGAPLEEQQGVHVFYVLDNDEQVRFAKLTDIQDRKDATIFSPAVPLEALEMMQEDSEFCTGCFFEEIARKWVRQSVAETYYNEILEERITQAGGLQ